MCAYNPEWYGFEIESKRHIMDLLIEPSFHRSVCTQFHEMKNGEYKAFYNFEPSREVFSAKIKECWEQSKGETKEETWKTLSQACADGLFKEDCQVEKFILNDDERQILEHLYEQELPSDVEKSHGLDGHSYFLIIYKSEPIEYYTWAVVPEEWKSLTDLINIVVDRASLESLYYGVYKSRLITETDYINLEIPPFLK